MAKATYLAILFAPERAAVKQAVLNHLSTIAERISEPTINKKGDETYQMRLKGGFDFVVRVFGEKKAASQARTMRSMYKPASFNNEYLYERIMYRIEKSTGVIECECTSNNTLSEAALQEFQKGIDSLLLAAAREADGLVRLTNLDIRNGSNELVYNLEGVNEQYSESTPEEFNNYFDADEVLGQKFTQMSLGKVSLPTGEISVCDALITLEEAYGSQPLAHRVKPGEYEVDAAVVTPNGDCPLIAAVRICFTDAPAVRYDPAQANEIFTHKTPVNAKGKTDVETNLSLFLYLDSGLACICDQKAKEAAAHALDEYEKTTDEEHAYAYNYFENLIATNASKDLFDQNGLEVPREYADDIFCLNWSIPKTDYQAPVFYAGYGDGAYPVWFGFDEDGRVCSLLTGFIDLKEELYDDPPKKKPSIANPLLLMFAALIFGGLSINGLMTGELLKVKGFDVHPAITLAVAIVMLIGGGRYLVSSIKAHRSLRTDRLRN
ncbi:MAG: DUF4241 domain-containing protein [Coriobacteriales bacterium]|jgi:hypothetical protein|nr:DUF4241 domain-containing protein [Coriobacteriales bacterium]